MNPLANFFIKLMHQSFEVVGCCSTILAIFKQAAEHVVKSENPEVLNMQFNKGGQFAPFGCRTRWTAASSALWVFEL